MQLDLAFSPSWARQDVGNVRVYTAPGFALVPDVIFELFPVVARTDADATSVLLHDVPGELEVRREAAETLATATGWPIALHQITLHEPAGGALRELRLLAHYQVLVVQGFVVVRATNPARFHSHRAQILELIASARFDLNGDKPAAISELWNMS